MNLGIHANPSKLVKLGLVSLPFIIMICSYLVASHLRHVENPSDKILPTVSKMTKAVEKMAFTKDVRTDEYLMLQDTVSSLKRLFMGISLAAIVGLLIGLNLGLFPLLRYFAHSFVIFISIIPPLSILPILFIVFGVDELSKVMLIFIGTFPMISRDIYQTVIKIPSEQITKALTLNASQLEVAYKIIFPQILPKLIDTVRLQLGPAWLFLIASEAIAAESGLGYRIFLVRRYLAMDTIIPYVILITLIGLSIDYALRKGVKIFYPWYGRNS